ncbi:MAG: ferredoxin [Phycisphaerae bacterium]|nr:ferredoxin [Phycisphaerae bacterium]
MSDLKVKVEPDLCAGCAVCESSAPDVFKMDDNNIAVVLPDGLAAAANDAVVEAAEGCPSEAIIVTDATGKQVVPK